MWQGRDQRHTHVHNEEEEEEAEEDEEENETPHDDATFYQVHVCGWLAPAREVRLSCQAMDAIDKSACTEATNLAFQCCVVAINECRHRERGNSRGGLAGVWEKKCRLRPTCPTVGFRK
jgi:hypothetical protein